MRPRIIPVLLVQDGGLYKTVNFRNGNYLGDPINAIRLFNEMEVDEIIVLDISATREGRGPDLGFIEDIASEAFMPFCYGGGISNINQVRRIFQVGVEKVAMNRSLLEGNRLIAECADEFGSQSIVGAIDIKTTLLGKEKVYDYIKGKTVQVTIEDHINGLENDGAGEIFLNFVDNDGGMKGYNLKLIERISKMISLPLIVCGGAGNLVHMHEAIQAGADAAAAGSLFVYKGKQRGVLINYPSQLELEAILGRC
ncbi:MAG: AglZ/HisF2 family acetamidino modification protein [Proteobacteria bacterium]|nr:AglZ/HisF2 family acetamidino modification protein [Pseudomonadota bacterium]MBU1688676.1 AglZ/HisF2 family acetamidino modification protein [Pseudomonadota bacterium]